jgi:hypothetical protein
MINHGYIKSTIDLSFLMLGQLELFTIMLILLTRFTGVNRYLLGNASRNEKVAFSVVFGIFGILATYMGVHVGDGVANRDAIANSRVVWVILGGILGGPWVGLCAGIIAGAHRFLTDIGGFTAHACGIATVVEGFLGGVLYNYIISKRQKKFDTMAALIIGILMEVLHMAIILLITRPIDDAFDRVKLIAAPMIVVNAVGIAIFVEMLSWVSREQARITEEQVRITEEHTQTLTKLLLDAEEIIFIKGKTIFPKITPEQIVFFHCQYGEVPGNTDYGEVLGHTYNDKYEVKKTMHKLEVKLSDCHFFRTHRSFLVNLNYVVEYKQLPNSTSVR